jgi:iron complex transport system substrate-binding protein
MRQRIGMLALALAVVAGACGDDPPGLSTTAPPPDSTRFPVTVRGTEIPALPERIASLSATHTEILFEIGAGPSVIATDLFSDHPEEALTTEKIDAFNLNVEAVAALDPDLVILTFDPGDAVAGLMALGIPVLLFEPPGPVTLDEVYHEWSDLGTASGREAQAAALIEQFRRDIDSVVSEVPETVRSFTYYLELDTTYFTAGPGTLLDTIFGSLGLANIAGADAGPYPQLSAEAILDADPDYVFLADTKCCGQTAVTVGERPGWDRLSAVANGNVIELDDDLASRWSNRLLYLVSTVANEVYGIG